MHALLGELVYTIPYHEAWYLKQYQGSNLEGKRWLSVINCKESYFSDFSYTTLLLR